MEAEIHSTKFQEGGLGLGKSSSINASEMKVKVWQASNEKIVFIQGEFETLDSKNVRFLIDSKKLGNKLIIGLIEENNGKGELISQNFQDRIELLSALTCVDLIIPIDKNNSISIIHSLKPDVVVYNNYNNISDRLRDAVEKYGGILLIK